MKHILAGAFLGAAMACAVAGPPGNAEAGRIKSDDARCQECHGADGHADGNGDGIGNAGKFPKLAGQQADYIAKQIRDFRAGHRKHETMNMMAATIDDTELADIAAYFAAQSTMRGEPVQVDARGRRLFAEGSPERGIAPCASCHGVDGKGGAAPIIGGQHKRYLQKQLVEWRSRDRANSPGGVMNATAGALTDDDIEAVADYAAGL